MAASSIPTQVVTTELSSTTMENKSSVTGTTVTDALNWILSNMVSGLTCKGTWDANANNPVLSNNGGGGVQGDFYIVGTAGSTTIDGESDWKIGDWILQATNLWHKIDNTDMAHDLGGAMHIADTLANLNLKISDATLDDSGDPRTPTGHKASHEDGGTDEISVANLSGLLADPQTPASHGSDHGDGTDAIAAAVPSGKFLKDDGTWDTPAGGGGSAFTIVDAGGGGDYTTIEAAAAAVTHGTIYVRAGLYSPIATIVLQPGVILMGENYGPGIGNGVIIDDTLTGPGAPLVTFTGGAPPVVGSYLVKYFIFSLSNDGIGVLINDSYVEVSNCRFANALGPGNSSIGIQVVGGSLSIEGLVSRCTFDAVEFGIEGINIRASDARFKVELCTFAGCNSYGITWTVFGPDVYTTIDVTSSDFLQCVTGIYTDAHLQADQLTFDFCQTGIEVDHTIHAYAYNCPPLISNVKQVNCDTVGILLTKTDGATIDGHSTTQCNGNPLHVVESEHFSIEGCHTNFNQRVWIDFSGEGYLQLSLDKANCDGLSCDNSYSLTVDLYAKCSSSGGVPLVLESTILSVFTGHVVAYATGKAAIELVQDCSRNSFDMTADSKAGICVDIGTSDPGNYSNTFRGFYTGSVKAFNIPVNNDKNIISGATAKSSSTPAIDLDSDNNVITGAYVEDVAGVTALDVSGNNNSIGSSTFDAAASGTEVVDTGAGNGLGAGGNISTHNKIL